MTRIYHRGEWFDEISPSALAESEFEEILVQNAATIVEDAVIVPFKKTVYSADGSARADLAIIPYDYRHWIVVEVEMSRHDLFGHVIPQVSTLRSASYTQEYVAYIRGKCDALEESKLHDMLRGDPPEVLVIVNKPDAERKRELRRYGAYMMVFEIFRSALNKHVFVIDGEPPRLTDDFVSELYLGLVPRCLVLKSPAALPVQPGVRFPVVVNGQVTYWERFHTATAAYLSPVGRLPVLHGRRHVLMRSDRDEYSIRPFTEKR